MKVLNQSIQLSNRSSESTVVKTCALFTFRALRAVTDQAKKAPGFFAQASADVQDAWRESSRPNV
jgi:acyl-CoA-binding protein